MTNESGKYLWIKLRLDNWCLVALNALMRNLSNPLKIQHIPKISTPLAQKISLSCPRLSLALLPFAPEISQTLNNPFRYLDHLCNFSRREDNYAVWLGICYPPQNYQGSLIFLALQPMVGS
jgi:hypothetical protein